MAATTACKLTVAGTGVTKQTVSRRALAAGGHGDVKPGSAAVRLQLTFRAGKYGTADTLVVAR